jgi:hypothetical protein
MVKQLATEEKGPIIKSKYPMFEWAPGIPIEDEVIDRDYNNNDDEENIVEQNDDNEVNENNEINENENKVVDEDNNNVYL